MSPNRKYLNILVSYIFSMLASDCLVLIFCFVIIERAVCEVIWFGIQQ